MWIPHLYLIHETLNDTSEVIALNRGYRAFVIADSSTFEEAVLDLAGDTLVRDLCPVYLTPGGSRVFITDLVSVKFDASLTYDSCMLMLESFGLHFVDSIGYVPNRWEVALDDTLESDAVSVGNALDSLSSVEWACASYYAGMSLFGTGEDPYLKYQYYLIDTSYDGGAIDVDIDADSAWLFASKVQEFRIAVIDDGIAPHPDLDASRSRMDLGRDFVGESNITPIEDDDPSPGACSNHGMACAGILAATHNGIGVRGVNNNATIIPIKMFDDAGNVNPQAHSVTLAEKSIRHATAMGARVISCSWGFDDEEPFLVVEQAILDAVNGCWDSPPRSGAVIVCASGNSAQSGDPVIYPANSSYAIAVGALDKSNSRWDYSCYGNALDIMAPAGDVIVFSSLQSAPCSEPALEGIGRADFMSAEIPNSGGDMWTIDQEGALGWHRTAGEGDFGDIDYTSGMGGTSGACPQVAGVAGLVLARRPDFDQCFPIDIVYDVLTGSAEDIAPSGWDSQTGYGRLNAYRAMLAVARCDANGDALYDIADVIEAMHQADASLAPLIHEGLSDLNCDGVVNGDDVTIALDIVFNDASWPDPCFEFDY